MTATFSGGRKCTAPGMCCATSAPCWMGAVARQWGRKATGLTLQRHRWSFECLLAGETVDCTVNDHLPYHRNERGENLWSALLETGYLTKAVTERMPLRIPNREIQEVFRQEVWQFFREHDQADNVHVNDLVSALWAGETGRAEDTLSLILEATLSFYHEYHEYSYHLILSGFFTGWGTGLSLSLRQGMEEVT